MSTMGQQRTAPAYLAMSALPPKADIDRRDGYVRFVPIDRTRRSKKSLLNHLVGAREQGRRHVERDSRNDIYGRFAGLPDQSALTPANFTTLAHFSVSAEI
jgi:hypothetical protein